MDNNEHQQHAEKQISPERKNVEKTKLLISRIDKTCFHQLRYVVMKVAVGVGVELRQIYSTGCRSHNHNDLIQQTNPNPTTGWMNDAPCLLSLERQGEVEGTYVLACGDGRE
jgi:hypothetical protein